MSNFRVDEEIFHERFLENQLKPVKVSELKEILDDLPDEWMVVPCRTTNNLSVYSDYECHNLVGSIDFLEIKFDDF